MNESLPPGDPVAPPPGRRWRSGLLLVGPTAIALALYAALPPRPHEGRAGASQGGCDHTPGADGRSGCPHGVNAEGGCNMNAAVASSQPQASPSPALGWTLPAGWVEENHPGDLGHATLRPPHAGAVAVSVISLPGTAGGELANVNRWRGQLGLPPLLEAALSTQRVRLGAPAGQVSVFDIHNPGGPNGRITVGMVHVDSQTWFLKLTGEERAVVRARPAFLRLLRSLRPADPSTT